MDDPDALGAVLGAEVTGLRRLAGGASRQTWAFDAAYPDGRARRLVLRRDSPAALHPEAMRVEARVLAAAHAAGVPVPAVHAHGDGSDGVGGAYLVMDRLDGETIPRRLLRDPAWARVRAGLAAGLGRALARVHAVPLTGLPLQAPDPMAVLREWHAEHGEPRPALALALRWLDEHRPTGVAAGPARTLVHGDFRNGNLMIGPDGLVAVLDWELAHLGDPVEDLGWLCVKAWRFGAAEPVGGFGPREELLDGYAEVAGWRPDPGALRWWEVYGTARWAVICRRQAERHLSGSEPSVELAVLGRRVCESEWDVLLALGLVEPVTTPDPLDAPDPDAGAAERPTVDELLAATGGFLGDELVGAEGLDARARFSARVAANATRIARRELRVGAAHAEAHAARLAALGRADDADLVAAIAGGGLDDRWAEVVAAVRAQVLDRLTVANPRYAAQPRA